jgi:hypothetical protein
MFSASVASHSQLVPEPENRCEPCIAFGHVIGAGVAGVISALFVVWIAKVIAECREQQR